MIMKILLAAGMAVPLFAQESPFGICSHMSRSEDFAIREQNMQKLNQAAIKAFRTDYDWYYVEPRQGEWQFRMYDDLLKSAKEHNLMILPIINSGTGFAHPSLQHKELWLRYINKMVARYKNDLRYWEVINEHNIGMSPVDYTKLLKGAYQTIKAIDPGLQVLYGGTMGIPFEYIETTLQQGAGDCFDIMNIHPYRIGSIPEYTLKRDILAVKNKMEEYGAADKPIWVTEYGHASARNYPYMGRILPAILRRLNLPTQNMKVAVLSDDDRVFMSADTPEFNFREFIPGVGEVKRVAFRELMRLDPKEWPFLIPTNSESFPMEYQPALVNYVKKGGTILLTTAGPLYYDARRMWDGGVRNIPDQTGKGAELRFGWEMKPARGEGTISAAPGFEEIDYTTTYKSGHFRHLTAANLKEGDRMIPVMNISFNDGSSFPVVGIFKLDSDFKGNVIMFQCLPVYENCTEEQQAKLLPRSYLVMLNAGVEKIFWYNFRSNENEPYNRECHFGIVRRDLADKPAFAAYKTMTEHYPAGSTPPELEEKPPFYHASWTKPDGDRVHALWQLRNSREMKLDLKGKVKSIRNHLGETVPVRDGVLTVSDGITYITGDGGLQVEAR